MKALQYKKTSHIGHLILTCLTGGLWIIVWILCHLATQNHNSRVDQTYMMLQGRHPRNQRDSRWNE